MKHEEIPSLLSLEYHHHSLQFLYHYEEYNTTTHVLDYYYKNNTSSYYTSTVFLLYWSSNYTILSKYQLYTSTYTSFNSQWNTFLCSSWKSTAFLERKRSFFREKEILQFFREKEIFLRERERDIIQPVYSASTSSTLLYVIVSLFLNLLHTSFFSLLSLIRGREVRREREGEKQRDIQGDSTEGSSSEPLL